VSRALGVVYDQLHEAAKLAGSVRRDPAPEITAAFVAGVGPNGWATHDSAPPRQVSVFLLGNNFRPGATAVLTSVGRPDAQELRAPAQVIQRTLAVAVFPDPSRLPGGSGGTWLVSLINKDETRSGQVEVTFAQLGRHS